MYVLYVIAMQLVSVGIYFSQFLSAKMKLFVSGRKSTISQLQKAIQKDDKTAWFHCASLGEYEQAVPIIEAFKLKYPAYKIAITFFSPSGYEVKKENTLADVTVYLPLDIPRNVRLFLNTLQPNIVFFIKYEIWPGYLKALEKRNTPTYLVSGLFRENQIFFKPFGGFMRNSLKKINHFFVQNKKSKVLLESINIHSVRVSGDTRFDRVSKQIEIDNTLTFIENFTNELPCIVCGSTWPEDEEILISYINQTKEEVKFVIAPHEIHQKKIKQLSQKLSKKYVLFSEIKEKTLEEYDILILDTIGLLSKVYSYASIAYVGGGMGTNGLHNILEPATFGVPVIIGNHYQKFPEAIRLRSLAGLYAVKDETEVTAIFDSLLTNKQLRDKTGMIAGHFINSNTGATDTIIKYLEENESL